MNPLESPSGAGQSEERSQFLEAFIAGTRTALSEMAGIEVSVRSAGATVKFQPSGDISTVVDLIFPTGGRFILSFPHRTAAGLAERVLAGIEKDIDENLVRDCVGEIANVVAGQAKTLLAGTPYCFQFSLPRVFVGIQESATHPSGGCQIATFSTELGEFTMQIEIYTPGIPGRYRSAL